ncbi:kelch-like protein 8 [Mercenaria mercenaria]|uniref:kelch-like protein 8 n=1 Tax=Mercenaria mercenaria TaxID=6596 RepID=UPI00234F5B02|nr:kelch-like protein 8 [Mercenaria mercenaria]
MESYQTDDRFVRDAGNSDLTLIVQQHKIQVHKTVLAVASPVFRTMFESDFKEKDQQEIELPGKKYEDFMEFLSCLYPNHLKIVTDGNVYKILPLAAEYQVKVLENRCAQILTETVTNKHTKDAKEIYRHIQLANLYKFNDLRSECIAIASDLSLYQLDRAGSRYPIADNDLIEIQWLALKKHELDKKDDDRLRREYGKYLSVIKNEINSYKNRSDKELALSSARLWYRYFLKDQECKKTVRENLKRFTEPLHCSETTAIDNFQEKLGLLPEMAKTELGVVSKAKRTDYTDLLSDA